MVFNVTKKFAGILEKLHTTTIFERHKKMDRASKSVWGASEINVVNDYKPGVTAMVEFGKTTRRVIQQGINDLGRWPWMVFRGKDNKVILIMSYLFQISPVCCSRG